MAINLSVSERCYPQGQKIKIRIYALITVFLFILLLSGISFTSMDFNVPLKEIQVSSSAISPQNTTIKPSEPSPVIDHVVILPNGTIRHNYEVDLSETITFRTELSGSHFIYYKYERYMWSLHGLTVLRNVLEQFKEDRENIVAMFIALAGMSAILLGLIRNRKILPHSR